MFINLTNHPSSEWSEEQLNAARQYSDHIMDLKFPNIEPEFSTDMVRKYAEVIVGIITMVLQNALSTIIGIYMIIVGLQKVCYGFFLKKFNES